MSRKNRTLLSASERLVLGVLIATTSLLGCGGGSGGADASADTLPPDATPADGATPQDAPMDVTGDAGPLNFAFSDLPPEDYTVQTDHLGVGLISTVLVNRSDSYNCRGVTNQLELLNLYEGVVNVHRMWADELSALGYPICVIDGDGVPTEGNILDFLTSVPCTLQEVVRVLPSGERVVGPRVIDLITPDFATIDVDEPAGFPNGRTLDDQITDLILGMGVVDMSELSLDQFQLNAPQHDRPFLTTFPYLLPPNR